MSSHRVNPSLLGRRSEAEEQQRRLEAEEARQQAYSLRALDNVRLYITQA